MLGDDAKAGGAAVHRIKLFVPMKLHYFLIQIKILKKYGLIVLLSFPIIILFSNQDQYILVSVGSFRMI